MNTDWAVLTFEVILFATYLTALIWSSLEAYFWGWDYYYSDCSDYDYSTHSYIDNPSCRARRDLLNGMSIAGAVLCGVMRLVLPPSSLDLVKGLLTCIGNQRILPHLPDYRRLSHDQTPKRRRTQLSRQPASSTNAVSARTV